MVNRSAVSVADVIYIHLNDHLPKQCRTNMSAHATLVVINLANNKGSCEPVQRRRFARALAALCTKSIKMQTK